MAKVLHIGAAEGEVQFYSDLGVQKLVYAEPDTECLSLLSKNILKLIDAGSPMQTLVIPKACSSISGGELNFYANGKGQSSLERPESWTKSFTGDIFKEYFVETISLPDLKASTFGDDFIDYMCIDTQGHERSIICSVDPQYLRANFRVIDVELMTDINQYAVSPESWKEVVLHLLRAGFEPIVHPHGITESYLFVNSFVSPCLLFSTITCIRDKLMTKLFLQHGIDIEPEKACSFSALGDHMFLPFSHIGGSIHASLLQPFREEFVTAYLGHILPKMIS